MKIHRSVFSLPGLLLAAFAVVADAQPTYFEDFNTTAYRDGGTTTADWDTSGGLLRLPVFAPEVAGAVPMAGWAQDVVLVGHHACVASATAGVHIVDIADPANPVVVGTYDTPGSAQGLDADGLYLFVADSFTLRILTIENPAAPSFAGFFDTPGQGFDVRVSGAHAYVADGNAGLQIVDVGNINLPVAAGGYDTPGGARGIDVQGDLVALADGVTGLLLFDVTTPGSPVLLGALDTAGSAQNVVIAGDHAFVADGQAGLVVADISDPSAPVLLAVRDTPGLAVKVSLAGDHAYVADQAGGLQVFDVSTPASPVALPPATGLSFPAGVAARGGIAVVADYSAGVKVCRIAEDIVPVAAAHLPTAGQPIGLDLRGDLAFVADYFGGLAVVDVSNPRSPVTVGSYADGGLFYGVEAAGDVVFAAGAGAGWSLAALDVSDPANPSLLGSLDLGGPGYAVDVAGDRAYVAATTAGIRVVDVSDPASLVLLGGGPLPDSVFDVEIMQDLAFVAANGAGLRIIAVDDPANMTTMGFYDTPGYAAAVDLAGHLAYVADNTHGLQIIDISSLSAPTLVGNYDTPGLANGISVVGERAYLADDTGLFVLDVSDPAAPILRDFFAFPGRAFAVRAPGDFAFVNDRDGGLRVVRVRQREVFAERGNAVSLAFNAVPGAVVRTRMSALTAGDVAWSLATTGQPGLKYPAFTDGSWQPAPGPLDALRWEAALSWADGVLPSADELRIDYLVESPWIEAVTDIPADQGRQVRLEWARSGHDFPDGSPLITEYAVYRRIGAGAAGARAVRPGDLTPSAAARTEALGAAWDFLGTVPVRHDDHYAVVVPTLADSTVAGGQRYTTFMVSALTATAGVFFDSPLDSGYSVDNIAPSAPTNIVAAYAAGEVVLDWDDPVDGDFVNFRVYRSADPDFVPGPETLVQVVAASTWTDPADGMFSHHYRITAVDYAGNESPAAAPDAVSGVAPPGAPPVLAMHEAAPNPFNPATTVSFTIPAAGPVSLAVHDVAGRRVRALVAGQLPAGTHRVRWDGRDDAGRAAASGVYLLRLVHAGEARSARVVLAK